MLDQEILDELKKVFEPLSHRIELVFDESGNPAQAELLEMLRDLEKTSSQILVRSSGNKNVLPSFKIHKEERFTGITFTGIPGGHEFSSLILAILNADGKGKLPDASISKRIARVRGPVRIKTYISLTCENCPDVVQALNQMALIHPDFQHEMVDGGYVQDEIQKLGIQGVPSVVVNQKMIHSGKIQMLDLLTVLEKEFGTSPLSGSQTQELGHFDVVVIGGGPAGASAAIYTVRKGLKTALLTERIGGQMQETKGIENFVSVTYTEGPALSAQLAQHLSSYPVQIFEQRRVDKIEPGNQKKIYLQGGETLSANAIIVATGAKWRELGIPGEKEYLGRGVAFCPHCDGPFYKGKKVAVVGGGNSGVEAAIDLAGIVREVVLFEFQPTLKADQVLVDKLKSLPNVSIITNAKTERVLGDGQKTNALEYLDRQTNELKKVELDGIFVQIGLLPNSGFLKGLLELTSFGEIVVDEKGRTSVPGIYAAGDVTTTPFKQIIIAMGEGAKAALTLFTDRMTGRSESALSSKH